jgi:ribokinase
MASHESLLPLRLITIIGSLNADITTYTSRIPSGGETLHARSVKTGAGGKGGNQAAACAKLSRTRNDVDNGSADIRMIGAVGNDQHGQLLLNNLRASGVDISGITIQNEIETGVAIILVEESTGENRILLNSGANYSLSPSLFVTIPNPKPSLLILQLEIPLQTTLQILKAAREAGIEILLNPAPAIELPAEAYANLRHLILNETEASILSGYSVEQIKNDSLLPIAARVFHSRGVHNVVITLGSQGVFYSQDAGLSGFVKAKKVEVVDTTAAGDTFVGAYALEAVKVDFDIDVAVRKANAAAAKTVGKRGAQVAIPWADEVGPI